METLQWATQDKSDYGDGPWMHEPDKMQWLDQQTGLPCLIHRGGGGALCGYVGVSPDHPWHGKGYSARVGDCPHDDEFCYECPSIDSIVDVHGGLTFADGCGHSPDPSTGICHVPGPGEPDDVWWFGFDCSHRLDFRPSSIKYGPPLTGEVYRDVAYVQSEVRRLAAQLLAVTS